MEEQERCDDYNAVTGGMMIYGYPPYIMIPPNDDHEHYQCGPNRHLLCEVRVEHNPNHRVAGPRTGPNARPPTLRDWAVCDRCDVQGRTMALCDRIWGQNYDMGKWNLFHEDGAHHAALRREGIPRRSLRLGAHHVGRLCTLCENTEIENYWLRRFGGPRRRTPAQAASTCRCLPHLGKRLCFADRVHFQGQVELDSHARAQSKLAGAFLHWLFIDPRDGRVKCAVSPVKRRHVERTRHGIQYKEDNACRCGRFIRRADVVYGADNVPTPVAMCTACDGVPVDVDHPRVVGWANAGPVQTLPRAEQGNLTLGRAVQEV